jgi:Tol biopolymer transport system component
MKKINYAFLTIFLGLISTFAQQADVKFYQSANWSPDGKYLSFTEMQVKTAPTRSIKADIYTIKRDGTEIKKVTGDEKNEISPSWSKDGKRIIFMETSADAKEANIYVINKDGTGLIQLTKNAGRNGAPVFSPDGKKIAFCSDRDGGKLQIYVMNADGANPKRLTSDSTISYYNPEWSPDGKKLLYYAEKGDRKDQIWTMKADGSNQTILTNNIGHNFFPSWAPDGKKIIFSAYRDEDPMTGEASVYVMNKDGSNITKLANIKSISARFSPDGKKIAYISGRPPVTAIFLANSDGSGITKLIGN